MLKEVYDMATRFLAEKAKWKKAGKPVRSDERIKELFKICSSNECGQYKKDTDHNGSCNVCGCNLKDTNTSLNKLAWSTTRCPLENPKWIEEENFQNLQVSDTEIEKEEKIEQAEKIETQKKEQQSNVAPKPKNKGCGCGGK